MRALRVTAAVLAASLAAGLTAGVLVGVQRDSSFDSQVAQLEATWSHDLSAGVPAARITPLEAQLRGQRPPDAWWSPAWWGGDGSDLLSRLRSATTAAYEAAMSQQRARAEQVLDAMNQELSTDSKWLTASESGMASGWVAQLQGATTPNQIASLTASWQNQLDTTRTEVLSAQEQAQQAELQAEIAAAGGPAGLIQQAQSGVTKAQKDDLDPGEVSGLASQLQQEVASGTDTTQTSDQLYAALQQLNQLFTLNSQLNSEMRPLELLVDQAAAEGIPNSTALLTQYQSIDQDFIAGTTYEQLEPLQSGATSLQASTQAALSSNQCGHDVGSGKVITISLSLEEMVIYDNGCVVNATPVTTGRGGLRTPTGDFRIFYKMSPFTFVSPWPPGNPDWYPTTTVNWVMEFAVGGYFIHDAYWEAQNAFGPGSQNEVAQDYASHGCVHTPTAFMQWLYGWTPLGTPVIITS